MPHYAIAQYYIGRETFYVEAPDPATAVKWMMDGKPNDGHYPGDREDDEYLSLVGHDVYDGDKLVHDTLTADQRALCEGSAETAEHAEHTEHTESILYVLVELIESCEAKPKSYTAKDLEHMLNVASLLKEPARFHTRNRINALKPNIMDTVSKT